MSRLPPHSAVQPPSTTSDVPVISAAASPARKTTAPIRSSTRAEAAKLDPTQDVVAERRVLEERLGQRRIDEGGPDRIHADTERGEVDRHGFGQALDAVLGHAIDGAVLAADMAHLRGDMDDRSALAGRRHLLGDRLRDEIGGAQVQAGDGVVVVLGDVQKGARAVGAGIVDQDVERVRGLDRRADGGRSVTSSTSVAAWPPASTDLARRPR